MEAVCCVLLKTRVLLTEAPVLNVFLTVTQSWSLSGHRQGGNGLECYPIPRCPRRPGPLHLRDTESVLVSSSPLSRRLTAYVKFI